MAYVEILDYQMVSSREDARNRRQEEFITIDYWELFYVSALILPIYPYVNNFNINNAQGRCRNASLMEWPWFASGL